MLRLGAPVTSSEDGSVGADAHLLRCESRLSEMVRAVCAMRLPVILDAASSDATQTAPCANKLC
jgi:hypothetical protein